MTWIQKTDSQGNKVLVNTRVVYVSKRKEYKEKEVLKTIKD